MHSFLQCGVENTLDGRENVKLWLEEDAEERGDTEEDEDDEDEEDDDADLFYQDERVKLDQVEWDEHF